jgi:hypothetical protein
VGGPEKLTGLEDAGEEQLGRGGHVRAWDECKLAKAIVAVAAGVGWLLPISSDAPMIRQFH